MTQQPTNQNGLPGGKEQLPASRQFYRVESFSSAQEIQQLNDPLGMKFKQFVFLAGDLQRSISVRVLEGLNNKTDEELADFFKAEITLVAAARLGEKVKEERDLKIKLENKTQNFYFTLFNELNDYNNTRIGGVTFLDILDGKFLGRDGDVNAPLEPYFNFWVSAMRCNNATEDTIGVVTSENYKKGGQIIVSEFAGRLQHLDYLSHALNTLTSTAPFKFRRGGNPTEQAAITEGDKYIANAKRLKMAFAEALLDPNSQDFESLSQAVKKAISTSHGQAGLRVLALLSGLTLTDQQAFYRELEKHKGEEFYDFMMAQTNRLIGEANPESGYYQILTSADLPLIFDESQVTTDATSDTELKNKASKLAIIAKHNDYKSSPDTILGSGMQSVSSITTVYIGSERVFQITVAVSPLLSVTYEVNLANDRQLFDWSVIDSPDYFPVEKAKAMAAAGLILDSVYQDIIQNRQEKTKTSVSTESSESASQKRAKFKMGSQEQTKKPEQSVGTPRFLSAGVHAELKANLHGDQQAIEAARIELEAISRLGKNARATDISGGHQVFIAEGQKLKVAFNSDGIAIAAGASVAEIKKQFDKK